MDIRRTMDIWRRVLLPGAICLGVCVSVSALADPKDEILRRDLSLIQDQIEHMNVILARIERRQAELGHPVTYYFDTQSLRSDLGLILQGVNEYLEPSRSPSRYIAPIDGDYIQRN